MNATESLTNTSDSAFQIGHWARVTLTTGATITGEIRAVDDHGVTLAHRLFEDRAGVADDGGHEHPAFVSWSSIVVAETSLVAWDEDDTTEADFTTDVRGQEWVHQQSVSRAHMEGAIEPGTEVTVYRDDALNPVRGDVYAYSETGIIVITRTERIIREGMMSGWCQHRTLIPWSTVVGVVYEDHESWPRSQWRPATGGTAE